MADGDGHSTTDEPGRYVVLPSKIIKADIMLELHLITTYPLLSEFESTPLLVFCIFESNLMIGNQKKGYFTVCVQAFPSSLACRVQLSNFYH